MSTTEPRSGIKFGWGSGAQGWDADMDANLQLIGRFGFHPSARSRTITAPPAAPAAGDTYIVAAGATDAWVGKDGQVAVWDGITNAWVFGVPRAGWRFIIEAESKITTYLAGAWTAGVAV